MSLSPLQTLRGGRYRLVSRLRAGGSGVVWRGVDLRDDVMVAFKAVPLEAGGAQAVDHEAEAAARVRHPGVLRLHAAFVEAGYGFVVMDLAACSLADVVDAHGPLPAPIALRVARDLCDTLGAAHAAGVVHRDVKPPNVLVLPDGSVRLADWGIARVHASGQGHTRTGALLGTIAFMAPEQRRDPRDVRPATDVYALAATLAWMVTGEPPGELYVGDVATALRARIGAPLGDVLIAAGAHAVDARPATGEALKRALAECGLSAASEEDAATYLRERSVGLEKDPWGRPSAADVVAERAAAPSSSSEPPGEGGERRARGFGGRGAVLCGLAAVAIGVGVGWAAWTRGQADGLARGLAEATRDPLADLPLCADAPTQWAVRVERGPRETSEADVVDVDGDGRTDVIFANTYSESATIWWGAERALPSERVDVPTGRIAPAVVDVDGDGLRDLVVALYNDARIGVARGLGGRAFGPVETHFQDPPALRVDGADVDRDGRADLAFNVVRDPELYLRLGVAKPTPFAPHRHLMTVADPRRDARILSGSSGVHVWTLEDDAVVRAPIEGTGLVGAATRVPVPVRPLGVLRDASHPEGAVVRVQGREEVGYVRVVPDAAPCLVGRTESSVHVSAFGDFDADGVADFVASRTCQYCDSNHVFGRGVR